MIKQVFRVLIGGFILSMVFGFAFSALPVYAYNSTTGLKDPAHFEYLWDFNQYSALGSGFSINNLAGTITGRTVHVAMMNGAAATTSISGLQMRIYSYDPVSASTTLGTLLYTSDFYNDPLPANGTIIDGCQTIAKPIPSYCFRVFTFPTDFTLTAGNSYAFIIGSPTTTSTGGGELASSQSSDFNTYPTDTYTLYRCTIAAGGSCLTPQTPIKDKAVWFFTATTTGLDNVTVVSPADGTTTGTTTDIVINYNNVSGNFTNLVYQIINTYLIENTVEYISVPISAASSTYTATTTLDNGDYKIEAYMLNNTTNQQSASSIHNFTVNQSQLTPILGVNPNNYTSITQLATSTCSFTNIAGCFQNAIVFLFYPSTGALQQFGNLLDAIKSKPPIGYFSVYSGALAGITASGTPVVSLASVDAIQTNIFTPVKNGLVWVFWFFFGVIIFVKVTKIKI